MGLITMFHDTPCGEFNYTKAIVREEAKGFFENLGFQSTPDFGEPDTKEVEEVKEYVKSGDEGCGLPGSISFMRAGILQSKKKQPIIDIINEKFNIKLPKRETVKAIKEKALKLIEELENGDS